MDKVCHLIEEHMFNYQENWSDSAVRRFVIRAGEENLPDIFALRKADSYGTSKTEPHWSSLLPLTERIEKILSKSRVLSLKDLAVSGYDLMSIGISPGKTMGIILDELLESVLDDPALNNKEKLLEMAGKIYCRYK